jgi:hypothetical protein
VVAVVVLLFVFGLISGIVYVGDFDIDYLVF